MDRLFSGDFMNDQIRSMQGKTDYYKINQSTTSPPPSSINPSAPQPNITSDE